MPPTDFLWCTNAVHTRLTGDGAAFPGRLSGPTVALVCLVGLSRLALPWDQQENFSCPSQGPAWCLSAKRCLSLALPDSSQTHIRQLIESDHNRLGCNDSYPPMATGLSRALPPRGERRRGWISLPRRGCGSNLCLSLAKVAPALAILLDGTGKRGSDLITSTTAKRDTIRPPQSRSNAIFWIELTARCQTGPAQVFPDLPGLLRPPQASEKRPGVGSGGTGCLGEHVRRFVSVT